MLDPEEFPVSHGLPGRSYRKLGGGMARTADLSWPKGYFTPECSVQTEVPKEADCCWGQAERGQPNKIAHHLSFLGFRSLF